MVSYDVQEPGECSVLTSILMFKSGDRQKASETVDDMTGKKIERPKEGVHKVGE